MIRNFFNILISLVHQLTATYNSIPLHSRPLAQNYISNTLLRHLQTQAGGEDRGTITVSTHPLPDPKTVTLFC